MARTSTTKYYIISWYEMIHIDATGTTVLRYSTARTDKT